MRTLADCILKPLAAFVLAAVVANCNDGCGPYISPAEAYAMEVSGCMMKYDSSVKKCANEAPTVPAFQECKAEAEDGLRICRGQVERKYLNYNSNGSYPTDPAPSN